MSRFASTLLLGVIALAGSSCTTTPEAKPEASYRAPGAGAQTAVLKGSNITERGLFGSDHVGFIFMVDLLNVDDAADSWDKPLVIAAGSHTIGVEYRHSNFHTRASLSLDASAGATYQLMIKPGRDNPEGPLYNEFWFADANTGRPVTQVFRRELLGGKTGTIFYNNK